MSVQSHFLLRAPQHTAIINSWGQCADIPNPERVLGCQIRGEPGKESEYNFKSLFDIHVHKTYADWITHCYSCSSYKLLHGYT